MNATEEQLEFIKAEHKAQSGEQYPKSIILSAVAGSGKTASSVGRLNHLIEQGVPPSKIIFFSFTNDAVNELKSRVEHDIQITTIHSFTYRVLAKLGMYKDVTDFHEFIKWYRKKYKPRKSDSPIKWEKYKDAVNELYENMAGVSSAISAYKLQKAENIKCVVPKYIAEYQKFQYETNTRDFSDMLIETEKVSKTRKFAVSYQGLYDYVFIDEYQDTSAIQMRILLKLMAKQYHLTGDKAQSIFGFSGANCDKIEEILSEERDVLKLSLTKNFRSDKSIIEYSNNYTNLKAVAVSEQQGRVQTKFINGLELQQMLTDGQPCAILVRTNKIIKKMELECLCYRIPMKYHNYFTKTDLANLKRGNLDPKLREKVGAIRPAFSSIEELLEFIEENLDSESFITTIHKSKGREYPRVIVVNSLDPDIVDDNRIRLLKKEWERFTFIDKDGNIDEENFNIHYVASTRAKNEMYFMLIR